MVDFCKKCKSMMIPTKKGSSIVIKCRKCGTIVKKAVKDTKIVEKITKTKGVILLEKDEVPLPTTDKSCPKCEHNKAYWWLQQTRSADEPPTQFFRCEKCNHVWREYK
ncbi:MAG: transcription factor S [Candidatus Aenigmarchaeota archaeon]|nr:transcription factor S [Candidatus Aenigmarchaeota archaeon]